MTDLEKRIVRVERALAGYLMWLTPPVDESTPGWKESKELMELLNTPSGERE